MSNKYALEMVDINKKFGEFYANKNINLKVKKGEVHALLGENGAGKSTLMNILFGLYTPTSGEILINGVVQQIDNPLKANQLHIGMVHQHFKLIDEFTVTENIMLGYEPMNGNTVNYNSAQKHVNNLANKYNLQVDPKAKVADLTVGQQQKVEILKMLYREAEILIFDEPTAVLTPQEIKELMVVIREFASQGKTVIIITHKLNEIKQVADRCTIIRKGEYIDTVDVRSTDEKELASLMVGRHVDFDIKKANVTPGEIKIELKNINYIKNKKTILKDINLAVRGGEIVGVAGVEGNGQEELAEILTGMIEPSNGKILINNNDVTNQNARSFRENKVAHIPSDRHKHGLVLEMSLAENIVLNQYYKEPFSNGIMLNHQKIDEYAQQLVENNDVRSAGGVNGAIGGLSGGNQQKAIIARELALNPEIIVASQPTRGVDVGSIENIHNNLLNEREKNKAIILVSYELDEIIKLSDKIIILFDGKIVGVKNAKEVTKEEIGQYMAGGKND